MGASKEGHKKALSSPFWAPRPLGLPTLAHRGLSTSACLQPGPLDQPAEAQGWAGEPKHSIG